MAASLSLHMCVVSMLKIPQKLQLDLSPQGLHKCPGSFAIAPQLLQVYYMKLHKDKTILMDLKIK